jgi:hypothetical protein
MLLAGPKTSARACQCLPLFAEAISPRLPISHKQLLSHLRIESPRSLDTPLPRSREPTSPTPSRTTLHPTQSCSISLLSAQCHIDAPIDAPRAVGCANFEKNSFRVLNLSPSPISWAASEILLYRSSRLLIPLNFCISCEALARPSQTQILNLAFERS